MKKIIDKLKEITLFIEKCSKIKVEHVFHNEIKEMCAYMLWVAGRATYKCQKKQMHPESAGTLTKELDSLQSHIRAVLQYVDEFDDIKAVDSIDEARKAFVNCEFMAVQLNLANRFDDPHGKLTKAPIED